MNNCVVWIAVCFILQVFCNGVVGQITTFIRINPKEPYDCCRGYHKIENECVPRCRNSCPKGQICLKENTCGCEESILQNDERCTRASWFEGETERYCAFCAPTYKFISRDSCEYNCEQECINGYCFLPGVCKCNPGYEENPTTRICELTTSLAHEDCVNEGSRQNVSSSTKTTVGDSTNDEDFIISTTNFPSNCQNDGLCFIEESTSTSTTEDCVDEISCQNVASSTKTTVEDSTNEDDFNISTTNFPSNCQNNCQNGVCSEEGKCKCKRGYILKNDSNSTCIPQCDRECVNSICVAPTNCECLEDDISRLNISSNFFMCESGDDKKDCLNGTLVAVNKCQCLEGFLPKPDNRFECVASLPDTNFFPRKWFCLLWITLILMLATLIVLACLRHKRKRGVHYTVTIQMCHGTLNSQPEC